MQDRRASARIDKIFRVLITSEETGDIWYVARNISESGMFVEMSEPLPLRTKVIVRFMAAYSEAFICAMGRIQNHYYFQFNEDGQLRGISGVGLRFLRFVPEIGGVATADQMH